MNRAHLGFCDLPQALQILQLGFKLVVRTVEPVPPYGSTMDSQRPANGITKFVWAELILARKYLDSFGETGSSLYRHFKAKGEIVDVDAAVSRQQWLVREDPEVSTATRLFERCLNPILASSHCNLSRSSRHSHSRHRSPPTWSVVSLGSEHRYRS